MKRALLVGVSDYKIDGDPNSDFPDLRTPLNDIEQLANELGKPDYGFLVEKLPNPEVQPLRKAVVKWLKEGGKEDLLLFYFSGHGCLYNFTEFYLCTKGTTIEQMTADGLSFRFISDEIGRSRCQSIIIILDCCYSGAAADAFMPKSPPNTNIRERMLNETGPGKGKYVISSSSATSISIELDSDDNSLFTKHLINGLRDWKADQSPRDSVITLDELYTYAKQNTEEERKEQNPTSWGFETQGPVPEIARKADVEGEARLTAGAYPEPSPRLDADLKNRDVIPFIGDRVYGSYALSAFELAKTITHEARLSTDANHPLVTAASYYEELLANRRSFLAKFREIVHEQSNKAAVPELYNWLVEWPAPWLIVSTTYDLCFEKMLREAGKPFKLICHMPDRTKPEDTKLKDRVPEEQILVVDCVETPGSTTFKSYAADNFVLDIDKERIIYKVLGSPCLSDLVEVPKDYDTVVVTEQDHFDFFSNLQKERAGKPTALASVFAQKPLLFLGYNLDIWHYRLLERLFRRGRWTNATTPFAVRQPQSTIEEKFWERLHAEVLNMDVDPFVRMMRERERVANVPNLGREKI